VQEGEPYQQLVVLVEQLLSAGAGKCSGLLPPLHLHLRLLQLMERKSLDPHPSALAKLLHCDSSFTKLRQDRTLSKYPPLVVATIRSPRQGFIYFFGWSMHGAPR